MADTDSGPDTDPGPDTGVDMDSGPLAVIAEGLLDRVAVALPGGGERRPGQRDMVRAVAGAIEGRRHLVVQAGTGTGKSLAYLLPAFCSGRRVVVATASKALQDQLAQRDLPFLTQRLVELGHTPPRTERPASDATAARTEPARGPTWAVLKGRANYLCLQRLDELQAGLGQGELTVGEPGLNHELEALGRWAEHTATGDRADLPEEPSPRAWAALSVSGDECPGAARCPRGGDCFAESARNAAADADVVVTNLALYGVHIASGQRILPEHEVVVIDECHLLEDVLSTTLGFELTAARFGAFAGRVRSLITDPELPATLIRRANAMLAAFEPHRGDRLKAPLPTAVTDAIDQTRGALLGCTNALRAITTSVADADQRRARAQRVALALTEELDVLGELPANYVAWVPEGGDTRVSVAPIDVGPMLAATVWEQHTAVLTSATIPTSLGARVGLSASRHRQLDVGSPFDYQANGLLYCALGMPDPRDPAYRDALHEELVALITAAGGRTLALFTSWRALEAARAAVEPRLPYPVLTQGQLPPAPLIERFRNQPEACLFATTGFFSGIDVPGATLSLVTVDRLPFPRPDDPLLQARRDRAGAAAFATIDVARAATLLAQAAGRLIRSADDRGVVAVLDRRLGTARYRWDIISALPPFRRTRDRAEVERFLAQLARPAGLGGEPPQ
ncbi:MAG: ATP-dependent DNA helicase [Acidimicrobiales bacterium]